MGSGPVPGFDRCASGIVNDPNREDDPEYIVRLVGQVVTVSVETVRLVWELRGWGLSRRERSFAARVDF